MRCSEKDQKLPKLNSLKLQNQGMKSNKKTGEEMDEIKCLKGKKKVQQKEKHQMA